MAFTSGSATNYVDLADKLRLFATANGWSQLRWVPGTPAAGGMELCLRGPGAGADKQVFINIQSWIDAATNRYSWDVRGATAYNATLTIPNQPGSSPPAYHIMWSGAINYWFYINDRRIIVVTKISTVYTSSYLGFGLPWATPAQYMFPLYIAASAPELYAYNGTNSAYSSMVDPGGGSAACGGYVRHQDGTWDPVLNRKTGTASESAWMYSSTHPYTSPYTTRGGYASAVGAYWQGCVNSGGTVDYGIIGRTVPTAQGERILLPISVLRTSRPAGIMNLDGVYMPMGGNLTPEQTASLGARNFRMFNNVYRVQPNHFFAIEES